MTNEPSALAGAPVASVAVSLVTLTGPDALDFLQSLASQDLAGLAEGATVPSLLLQPQGKLLAAFLVHRRAPDELWLVADAGVGETLRAGLARFKIRVKVDIEDRSDRYGAVDVRTLGPEQVMAAPAVAPCIADGDDPAGPGVVLPAPWHDEAGTLAVVPNARVRTLIEALVAAGGREDDAAAHEVRRIEHGIPKAGAELDESVIAQEAFLEQRAVSFTKGCFVGQELVCRIDSRGHVNRFLRGLVLGPDAAPPAVGDSVEADGKPVGSVTSAARSAHLGAVALGYVRREVEPGTVVTVGGVPAEVRALPMI